MENNQRKKKYGAGILAVSLVIGLSIGFCAGFLIGGHTSSGDGITGESGVVPPIETIQMAESGSTETPDDNVIDRGSDDTEEEPIGSFAVDDEPVLTINDTVIYLSEVNARAYMARDRYVSLYGEEPWSQEVEDGITVAEYAKNTMLEEMVRITILCGKADTYGVEALTEDEKTRCDLQADDYMAALGKNVAAQFSVEHEAMLNIYEKDALSMKVYNKILGELTEDLRSEDAYMDMDDSEFEQILMQKFNELYTRWKEECIIETTETWNQMVIGAVG